MGLVGGVVRGRGFGYVNQELRVLLKEHKGIVQCCNKNNKKESGGGGGGSI